MDFRRNLQKTKTQKNPVIRKPQPSVRHSSSKKVPTYATERAKKIAGEKRKNMQKAVLVALRVIVLALLVAGIGWGSYYVVQSGKGNALLNAFGGAFAPLKTLFIAKSVTPKVQDVIGVSNVPSYPNSEFIFEELITRTSDGKFTVKSASYSQQELQTLYTFLSSGQSVYRLPIKITWEQVQSYYREELPKKGWTYMQSVGVSETEKLPGEYYTRDTVGIHIYQISYDVWYETITKKQAEEGLRDKVVAYKAKQELVQAATGQDLSTDTWWQLKYSKDWTLETANSPVYGEKNLIFTHDKSKERVSISILKRFSKKIADVDYKYLEEVANEHIISWLSTQQTSVTLGGFNHAELIIGNDMKAVQFADVKHNAYFLYLVNKENSLTYVVQYVGKEKPEFYEYIKANLKAVRK